MSSLRARCFAALALLAGGTAAAGVLPEDRADVLYHRYDGGGVEIDGPSVLVRKKIGESFAASANYYIDMVSSASIDVISTASPYKEERKQYSLGLEYLRGKSTYSLGYINSTESDYEANTGYVGISQDMFGDLTTISFGFKFGDNDVFRNIRGVRDDTFAEKMNTRTYSVGLTQVITRDVLATFNFETITDEGYLNSPYRSVRFRDTLDPRGYGYQGERYPGTRTSNAFSARAKYYLPWWRASADAMYRFYNDTWGIQGHTLQLQYTHPWRNRWTFDGRYRFYKQDAADFYSDLFPRANSQNFMARDKELSTYIAHTVGFGVSYEFGAFARAPWIQKSSANFRFDHLLVDYDDFHDVTKAAPVAGTEPLYKLDANVFQLFFSVWF